MDSTLDQSGLVLPTTREHLDVLLVDRGDSELGVPPSCRGTRSCCNAATGLPTNSRPVSTRSEEAMMEQDGNAGPAVYVQTNDATNNEVLAFERHGDGRVGPRGQFATGGRGTGEPHLPSQRSIVLSDDGSQLLVVNAGSDELSLFAVEDSGLRLADRVDSCGATPTSVAVRRH